MESEERMCKIRAREKINFDHMLKRWCSIKEIEVYLLCEILTSKDTLQGQKTVASLLKAPVHRILHHRPKQRYGHPVGMVLEMRGWNLEEVRSRPLGKWNVQYCAADVRNCVTRKLFLG